MGPPVPARLYQAVRPLSLLVSSLLRRSEKAEAALGAASFFSTGLTDGVRPYSNPCGGGRLGEPALG